MDQFQDHMALEGRKLSYVKTQICVSTEATKFMKLRCKGYTY
jgi:hypothetical protein